MNPIFFLFPNSYEESRARFRENLSVIRQKWAGAELSNHHIAGDEDLTIDWISAPALERNEKVLIFSTAEHGIEGYVGSAMQQRFVDRYLEHVDARTTGLLLIHALNPWGMKYHRRVNPNNVDLNRTFVWSEGFDRQSNPEYDLLTDLIHSEKPIGALLGEQLAYGLGFLRKTGKMGWAAFKSAYLLGQYRHAKGLFYGGDGLQEETKLAIRLYRSAFENYEQLLHLDMHTGYGPRYQMSLVNSVHERRSSQEFEEMFNYPLVVAANPEEFYAIQGDMIDYVYEMWRHDFPEKKLYATAFEFGTYGDKLRGQIGMPYAMSFENRLFWQGAKNERSAKKVKMSFEELFNPSEKAWKEKAVQDADQAFEGILKTESYWVD